MMRTPRRRGWEIMVIAGLALAGMTGCDYWPPALQAQIEQLKAETQAAAAERANLETQLKEAVKAKDEVQIRLDELTRLNRELAVNVTTLKQALDATHEKAAKASKGGKVTSSKATAKKTPAASKKKSAKKRT